MIKLNPGDRVRFTYLHPPDAVDEFTGDQYKEVLVLNPMWMNRVHGIDLKRLTTAEREVLYAIMDPKTKEKPHRLPLVNDIVRRMDPLTEIKSPQAFYSKFVKVFLRQADAYRQYDPRRMTGVTIVKETLVKGTVSNSRPLFHKIESKQIEKKPIVQTKPTSDTEKQAMIQAFLAKKKGQAK